MCNTLHATCCDRGAIHFGRWRSFRRRSPASPSLSLSTLRMFLPISTSIGAHLSNHGLQWMKDKTMPTHKGSYMCEGQSKAPGETTNIKSHTLLKSRRHLRVMRHGIKTMWVKLVLNNSSKAAQLWLGQVSTSRSGPSQCLEPHSPGVHFPASDAVSFLKPPFRCEGNK